MNESKKNIFQLPEDKHRCMLNHIGNIHNSLELLQIVFRAFKSLTFFLIRCASPGNIFLFLIARFVRQKQELSAQMEFASEELYTYFSVRDPLKTIRLRRDNL